MSNDRGSLAKALAAAQAELRHPKKDATNPHFRNRYASLTACLDAALPVLSKHGLALSQPVEVREDGVTVLRTVLLHESGESLEATYPLRPVKDDPQGMGSALTYARRYSLCSLVAIAADDDDDGAQASEPRQARRQEKRAPSGKASGWRKAAKPGTCEDCSSGFGADGGFYRYDEHDTFHAICAPCANRRKQEAQRAEEVA